MNRTGPIRVLLVDDSPGVRSQLTRVLAGAGDLMVVGAAKDPFEARELIIAHRPDVIILDVEMPRMDGLTFLKKLKEHYPVPVIVLGEDTAAGRRRALEAIEEGAFDAVVKPETISRAGLGLLGDGLIEQVRAAVVAMPSPPAIPSSVKSAPSSFRTLGLDPRRYLVTIGASTGGTEAIRQVLAQLPDDFPPVVMVQHMPEGFTRSFAMRLDQLSPMTVSEAEDRQELVPGLALLARGGTQMEVQAKGGRLRVAYGSNALVNRHCPSVDVLFNSVARAMGKNAIGVLLTGMGDDGAAGLLNLRQAGAITVAQDKRSCVVFGMPKVAIELGAAQHVAALRDIPHTVIQAIRARERETASAGSRIE